MAWQIICIIAIYTIGAIEVTQRKVKL